METRKDLYLKRLGDFDVAIPNPTTQEEKILAELAGNHGLGVELPSVSASDNGKVLTVADGQWTLGEGGSGGSSSSLKYVKDDPSDNGGVIEGYITAQESNIASGQYSHAEGYQTMALAPASHVEGRWTQSTVNGYMSHAEGDGSTVNASSCHAEGCNTSANGNYSHSEGSGTVANGGASHAEGFNTIASSAYQHVQGQYNVEDNNSTYAFIIGNGTDDNSRSNALTVDWGGNLNLNGKATIGATPTNDMDVATKKYVDDTLNNSGSGGNGAFNIVVDMSNGITTDVKWSELVEAYKNDLDMRVIAKDPWPETSDSTDTKNTVANFTFCDSYGPGGIYAGNCGFIFTVIDYFIASDRTITGFTAEQFTLTADSNSSDDGIAVAYKYATRYFT